jgi:hypothetical protein
VINSAGDKSLGLVDMLVHHKGPDGKTAVKVYRKEEGTTDVILTVDVTTFRSFSIDSA